MQSGESYNPKGLFTGVFIPESMARLPHSVLSAGAKLLFGRLCWHVSDKGECFPSRVTLAEEIGVSEFSARDYLKELEDQSFIRRVRNGPHTNDYEFTWNDVLEGSLRKKDRQYSVDQGAKKDRHSAVDQPEKIDTPLSEDRHSAVGAYKVVRESLREVEANPLPLPEKTFTETRSDLEQQLGRSLKNSEMSRLQAQSPYPDGPDVLEWAKSKNIIDETKAKTKWPKREDQRSERKTYTPPTTEIAISERAEMDADTQFADYISTYKIAGKAINPTKHCIPAWRKWKTLTQSERDGSLRDAQRQAIQTRDGVYLPSPIDHLNTSPWETIAMARVLPTIEPRTGKRNVNDEAREMYYREHPEERPHA